MMKKQKIFSYILIAILCGAVFYILGEPCRAFFKISETTEVRVTAPLPFLFTIAFGITGAIGCAFANLIADLEQSYPLTIAIPGFFCQVLYGVVPAYIWKRMRKKDANKFKMDRVYKVVQYLLLSIGTSILVSAGVNLLVKANGLPDSFQLWINIFFNQLTTMLALGIPFMVGCSLKYQLYLRKKNGYIPLPNQSLTSVFSFSLNEKFLLFFVIGSIIIAISNGGACYEILIYKRHVDPIYLWNYVFCVVGATLNVSLWSSLAFLYYMEKNVTRPVENMSAIASIFGEKTEIDEKIASIVKRCQKYVYFTSEVGDLARSFKTMSNELDIYVKNLTSVAAEQQKVHTELTIATTIQVSSLPKLQKSDRLDMYAMMAPALEVGGDFYDFFRIDDDHMALLIADVSGKGVPAALFMMVSKIILRQNLRSGLSPAKALEKTNNELSANNPIDMFVSCLCGILDLNTGVLKFSNAGHERPAIRKKNGKFFLAKIKTGLVLGGMSGMKYSDDEILLEPGDVMFTYTDGVPEAMDEGNHQYGNDRMLATLNANIDVSVEELCKNMREDVRKHAGKAPQFDDITMLAFSLKGQDSLEKSFKASEESLTSVQEYIYAWTKANKVSEKSAKKLAICTDEIVSNIVSYGGADLFSVAMQKEANGISVKFSDNGKPFNPLTDSKDPDITASAEDREIGGLGIFMVKKMMDEVTYERKKDENELTLRMHDAG